MSEVDWRQLVDHTSICDFCGEPPTWMHEAREFGIGTQTESIITYDPFWAACDGCHELIMAHDSKSLVERMYKLHERDLGPWSPDRAVSVTMYLNAEVLGFMANQTGKVEAFG